MTGKSALPQIHYHARQALLRRDRLGLPCLYAKAHLTRVERLIARVAARAEIRIAQQRWKAHKERVSRWHAAGCPVDQARFDRFESSPVPDDEELERLR